MENSSTDKNKLTRGFEKDISKTEPETDEQGNGTEKSPLSSSTAATVQVGGKQLYRGSAGARALQRAGNNPQLKGHVHEIMMTDKININPKNILSGKKAVLTKSPTAVRDDIVIKQAGKVVGRMQLKDTTSASGIAKTIKQAGDHKYQRTLLVGTKETAEEYAKKQAVNANVTQNMVSSGISSAETELTAMEALGKNVLDNSDVLLKTTKTAAKSGAAISAGIETISSGVQVYKGEKSLTDAALSVGNEAAIGAASATAGHVVSTSVTAATAPIAGPAAPVIGAASGMAASVATDKVLHKTENKATKAFLKRLNQKAEKKQNKALYESEINNLEQKKAKRIIGNRNTSKKKQAELDQLLKKCGK